MNEEIDRWQALAAELGLPSGPTKNQAPAASVPPVESVAPKAPPEPAHAEPERHVPREDHRRVERVEYTTFPPEMDEPADLPPITTLDPPILDPMLEGPSPDRLPDLDEPGNVETDRPRGRGGRRGQRGGRGGRGRGGERTEPATPESAAPAGEGPPEESPRDDRSRRGGRGGRGRRPPERRPEPEPELEEVVAEDEHVETPEEDFDDGPEDNLADLNVPPWADIIASLYRPDR